MYGNSWILKNINYICTLFAEGPQRFEIIIFCNYVRVFISRQKARDFREIREV